MHRRRYYIGVYYVFVFLQATAGSASALISGYSAIPENTVKGYLGDFGVQSRSWAIQHVYLVFVSVVIFAICKGARAFIGSPRLWQHVQYILDQLQILVFTDRPEGELHYHRATLFRRDRFHLCKSWKMFDGWLLPVARSGHTSQKTKTAFRIPDNADAREGIAGKTWNMRRIVSVSNLPDVSTAACSDEDVRIYSEKGCVTEHWIRAEKPTSRSILGIPVEVKSAMWGVIVLDSRSPKEIGTDSVYDTYNFVGKTLGKLLERFKI